jgi:uncharacterized protein YndB with AHSA1/START domain
MERLFDATPEIVFDAYVDPDAQQEIWDDVLPGWRLIDSDIDLRVGGTWTIVFGSPGGRPDRVTSVFTVIERPHRLVVEEAAYAGQFDATVHTTVTLIFEDRQGKTLLRILQTGFETKEARDGMESGWPAFLDALKRAVASRITRSTGTSRVPDPTSDLEGGGPGPT